ncbi:MAG TPA: acetylxylan esterase [Terriglobia bacterium]|nr:acetylxylan esterase [Terriglobia bacterium]
MNTSRLTRWFLGFIVLALVAMPQGRAANHSAAARQATQAIQANGAHPAADPSSTLPPVAHLTSEQDHQRTMDLLHIKSLRPGADPNHPGVPNYVNYDESKANPYPNLPNPLVLNNGKKVTTAAMWWKVRRPQIVREFNEDVYGWVPKRTPKVNWEVTSTTHETNGGVPVITKHLVGHVDNSSYPLVTVSIQLTLTTPASAKGSVPVMMQFGFDPAFFAQFRKRLLARGIKLPPPPPGPTWQQQLLAKGWGYAVIVPYSVQADNGAGLTEGIIGLCNKGQPRKPDQWGALRAWAWGASRALDYFETDPAVDAKQVGLEGHSRFGKATLVAMAYDPRFAIAYVSSSGMGGATLYRRHFGELLENVAATNEYHWMVGNFLKYAGPLTPNDLPVDSHELIAMCAPRPVFISGGATKGDGWVDARGMFMAAAAASPVYDLLGKKGLESTAFPPIGTPLLSGDLAFRQHHQGHTDLPNWPWFIKFASRYLKAK